MQDVYNEIVSVFPLPLLLLVSEEELETFAISSFSNPFICSKIYILLLYFSSFYFKCSSLLLISSYLFLISFSYCLVLRIGIESIFEALGLFYGFTDNILLIRSCKWQE